MPITAIKEQSVILEKTKELEYKQLFAEEIKSCDVYQNTDETEKEKLISNIGRLALCVVSSSESLVSRSPSKLEGLDLLQQIYNRTIDIQAYSVLVQQNKFNESYKFSDTFLIKICSNDDNSFNTVLSFSLEIIPENIDTKPYEKHYLKYCHKVVDEIKSFLIVKYQQELSRENATTATATEPESASPQSKKKRVTFFDNSSKQEIDAESQKARSTVRRDREGTAVAP